MLKYQDISLIETTAHVNVSGYQLDLCRGVGMGKQVGSMDEESQVRGCYNITFICIPTNQETVSVLEKTQANKTFRIMKANVKSKQQQLLI